MSFATLKQGAKERLSKHYAISLFFVAIPFAVSAILSVIQRGIVSENLSDSSAINFSIPLNVVTLAITFFVILPLTVGAARGFIGLCRSDEEDKSDLFYYFEHNYMNVVLAMTTTTLFISIGLFLFFIPGIIFGLQWAMVPSILADNPVLTGKEARARSKAMMQGHKVEYIMLVFSFIGWVILGILTAGIAYLFYVQPYMNHTYAGYYEALKENTHPYI